MQRGVHVLHAVRPAVAHAQRERHLRVDGRRCRGRQVDVYVRDSGRNGYACAEPAALVIEDRLGGGDHQPDAFAGHRAGLEIGNIRRAQPELQRERGAGADVANRTEPIERRGVVRAAGAVWEFDSDELEPVSEADLRNHARRRNHARVPHDPIEIE